MVQTAIASNVVLHGDPLIDRIKTPNLFLFGTTPPGVEDFVGDISDAVKS
jgi:hypothetical protein